MCGISGYISNKKLPLSAMTNALHHRGVDATGSIEKEINNRYVGLGHNRLSIIDLSENGNQPFSSPDGKVHLIYNGETYNFQELKATYLANEKFSSSSDTEVLLKLYLLKGIDFVYLLNGDFAFAILDENSNKLHLVRDRAGVKPLYFHKNESSLVFGSEIKAIIKAGVQPQLDSENLMNYFVFKYSPKSETLFKNIFKLPPAHIGTFDFNSGTFETTAYWQPKKQPNYNNISYPEAQEELRNLMQDAVEKRLIADVPIGTFLSGGIDSSIIASYLKNNTNIKHYCAGKAAEDLKKEGTTSDYYYAEKLANEWNLSLSKIAIGSDNTTLENIKTTIQYSDDLIADGSQIPSYLIAQQAAKHSKVILSGMGADELFLGYAGHQLALIDGWLHKMPLSVKISHVLANLDQGKGKFKAFRRYLHKLGKYHNYPNYRFGIYTIVGDFENAACVFGNNKEKTIDLLASYFPEEQNPFDAFTDFEHENFLQKNVAYFDRMTMANSIEARVPFLDYRIIELAYALPRKYKLNKFGKTKAVLKDAYKTALPNYITNRRKAGFGMPLRSIFSSEEKINELLDKDFFYQLDGFSMVHIERIVQAHLRGEEDNSALIYALISFQEWYKMYID